jgi:hypothetical protein
MTDQLTNPVRKEETLTSFLLFTYNQEAFVREAVLAALAQDYSPLEIIISDDCSRDNTFAIIEELTKSYAGPHRLVVRRNPVNLGWIAHVNEVVQISSGEWIVMAAGDDVSFASRARDVRRLANEYEDVKSIFHSVRMVGEAIGFMARPEQISGVYRFPDTADKNGAVGLGAAHAWNREIWDVFGPLPEGLHREDAILPFRASLLGSVLVDPEPGVIYRISSHTLSRGYFKGAEASKILQVRKGEVVELDCMLSDLEVARKARIHDSSRIDKSIPLIQRMLRTAKCQVAVLDGGRIKRILIAVFVLLAFPGYRDLCGNLRFRIYLFLCAFK